MNGRKYISTWAWPWDLADEGPREAVKFIKNDLGMNAVSVAAVYHAGKFLLPRNSKRRVYNAESGVAYFQPDTKRYRDLKLQPLISSFAREENAYPKIVEACAEEGLNLSAWVIALHNSGLGRQNHDCCQHNAYGDVHEYALCPANPHSREYLKVLVGDIVSQFSPFAVDIESPNYIGYVHHMHHERTPVNHGDFEVFLLSLCFCDSCRAMAKEEDIDIDGLQAWVKETLDHRLNEDWHTNEWRKKNMEDFYALLIHKPEMMDFIRARQRVVTSLVQELKEICARGGSKLFTISSIFAHPSNQAWTEGSDIPRLSEVADALTVCAFYPNVTEFFDDLRFAVSVVPQKQRLIAGIKSYMPAAVSKELLLQQVSVAKSLGISNFSFSNYSCTDQTRLGWLVEAVKAIGV